MTDFFCNRGYFKTKSLLVFEKKTYAHWYQPDPTVTNLVFLLSCLVSRFCLNYDPLVFALD